MFTIICNECQGKSVIKIRESESELFKDQEVAVDGDISIDCGDWFIEQVSCKCGNTISHSRVSQ